MTAPRTPENVDWLAQQYVLGELSERDAAGFEACLANDETACVALAQATQLVLSLQAVAAPRPLAVPVRTPDRFGRQLVALAAVAACCLFTVLAWSPAPSSSPRLVRAEIIQAKELVNRWRIGRSLLGSATMVDDDDIIADAGDRAPSWMLAAVSIEQQKPVRSATDDEVWEDN